jgi:hypothetical protein
MNVSFILAASLVCTGINLNFQLFPPNEKKVAQGNEKSLIEYSLLSCSHRRLIFMCTSEDILPSGFKIVSHGIQGATGVPLGHLQKRSNRKASGHSTPTWVSTAPFIYAIYSGFHKISLDILFPILKTMFNATHLVQPSSFINMDIEPQHRRYCKQ